MLNIEAVEDAGRLSSLEAGWNELLQRSASDGIFLTWEWVSVWWEVYGGSGRYRPLVLVARDGEQVVGVAPLMVDRVAGPMGQLAPRQLRFIGTGEDVTPEYLDFFVERGREQEVSTALCAHLLREQRDAWDTLLLERLLRDSPNFDIIRRALGQHEITLQEQGELECPFAALPPSWDEYLASCSKHFRKRIGYNDRRLERDGEVRYLFVDDDIPLEQAYELLVQLNRHRFGEEGQSFRSAEYVEFHRRLCQQLLPRGWVLLAVLKVGEEVAAVKYDYCYGGKLWGNQGGWSREWEKKEVGNVMIGRLIRWGIERGYKEYDFLGGADEYKQRWSTASRQMVDLAGHNVTLRGRLFRLGDEGKRWLREHVPPETYQKIADIKRSLKL